MIERQEIAKGIIAFLTSRQWTIGLAESCSAGRLATLLTNVPGASLVVAGSIVAYQDRVKRSLLRVSPEILEQNRSVSKACAQEMAHGVQQLLDVNVAVAITGSCGPTSLDPHSAVGQVYISICWPGGADDQTLDIACHFEGSREQIADQAAWRALEALERLSREEGHAD
jgi:nicotinamide-nucleotide amidase